MKIVRHHFTELVSTNDWAKEQMPTFGHDALTVVTADMQTGGRGQYGRKWISPKGDNLYASFCFYIDEKQQDPLSLTHVLALSIASVLDEMGIEAQIKWPNDLLARDKKMAGILCETMHLEGEFGVVIGVGINVNMEEKALEEVGQPATSIKVETGQEASVEAVLLAVQKQFSTDLDLFIREGFTPFFPAFRKRILPGIRTL